MNTKIKEYVNYYEKHILEDIMPFWDKRCIDNECGGYFTCFDREGNITDDRKYIWFQGRQLYIYAFLYNEVEKREEWLKKAKHGYEFLIQKAYAGNGRWQYVLDREGAVLEGTISIFSDFHVIHGLAEYLKAINMSDAVGMRILKDSYEKLEKNVFDPEFKEIYENTWSPVFIWHDMYLTCLATVEACYPVLGSETVNPLLNECVEKITAWFANDQYKVIFEAVTRNQEVDLSSPKGRFINPGHMHESSWFVMEAGVILQDRKILNRGLELAEWSNRVGEDKQYGGIISYADALGGVPEPIDWFAETNSLWNEKVWWPNAEALACYAIAYARSKDKKYFEMFERQHDFCKKFYDSQYGEWYERLEQDGCVKNDAKGTPWKCAFHLVRALINVRKAFFEMGE